MAFYLEEQVWKCAKHPSKRHRSGICPVCLHDKLASLCPDCANSRPCACRTASSSNSSYSYSSLSCFSSAGDVSGIRTVGKVSNLIETEPVLRRSSSLTIPFFRSKQKDELFDTSKIKTTSFWSMFRASNKSKGNNTELDHQREVEDEKRRRRLRESRSMAMVSRPDVGQLKPLTSTEGKGWYLPTPMKVLRVSKLILRQHSFV